MKEIIENADRDDFTFSASEIQGFVKTQQDFLDGKTTARDWEEIEDELDIECK